MLNTGCKNEQETTSSSDKVSSLKFKKIDSIYLSGDINETNKELDNVKRNISNADIEDLTYYYYYKGQVSYKDTVLTNKYADSALNLYKDATIQKKYKNSYAKALMLKSDVYIVFRKYDEALETLFKIKSLLKKEDNALLYASYISKIAELYYLQGRFKQAAKYHNETYSILLNAQEKPTNIQNIFHLKQGSINNAGFSYERAGMLDSAAFFYQKGLAYIAAETTKKLIPIIQLESSKLVFLDNLGGIMLNKGDLVLAKKYLEESISCNNYKEDKSKGTAYLKLAKVYIQLKQFDKAETLLATVEKVNNDFITDIYEIKPRLLKAKSELYLAKNDYQQAFLYLNEHNVTLDSIRNSIDKLSKTDLALKFESIQNKQDLQVLAKANENKTIYLVCIGIFFFMLIPIIFLINKNAIQAVKAKKASQKHSEELEKAMAHLEARNKDYAKMMKVMAHDLKNPLGGMVGISNLLLEEDHFSKDDKEMLQLISNSGENAIEMINELLNSGLAVENEALNKTPIDIQQLLRQCTELLQYKASEKQQKIIMISGGPAVISISREKIWRVLNNLIVNAIKFSPPKTEINVVLQRLAHSICIKIIDQGIGVPQADKQKIFEMFTSAKRPGTAGEQPFGIGLSISKQIIESHKGKIWLEDNPNGGTIFYIELPLT